MFPSQSLRPMLGRLLLLFLLTPFVELALLIQVDRLIGFWPTMGVVIVTGLAGSFLARREGLSVWRRFNRRLAGGGLPGRELIDGVIVLIAGALLITPGVLTDVVGFIGLIPLTRAPIRRLIMRRLQRKIEDGAVQLHVGGFGVSSPSPEAWSASHHDRSDDATWHGTGRQMPRHSEDPGPADEQRDGDGSSQER